MLGRSDVNQRLPRFREALASIDDVRKKGGLDVVSQAVRDRLDALEPIGLDRKGHPVLPRNYDHVQQPHVLMMFPGEAGKRVLYRSSTPELTASNYALQLAGVASLMPSNGLTLEDAIFDGYAWVNHTTKIVRSSDDPTNSLTLFVPRLMYVSSGVESELLGTTLAHESDHWDFFFDEGPRIQAEPGQQLTDKELRAISEKRAYQLSYVMERTMGNYGSLEPVSVLAERYADKPPTDAEAIYDDLAERREAAGIKRRITAPLAVLAISHLYGSTDKRVTEAEVVALEAAGLI